MLVSLAKTALNLAESPSAALAHDPSGTGDASPVSARRRLTLTSFNLLCLVLQHAQFPQSLVVPRIPRAAASASGSSSLMAKAPAAGLSATHIERFRALLEYFASAVSRFTAASSDDKSNAQRTPERAQADAGLGATVLFIASEALRLTAHCTLACLRCFTFPSVVGLIPLALTPSAASASSLSLTSSLTAPSLPLLPPLVKLVQTLASSQLVTVNTRPALLDSLFTSVRLLAVQIASQPLQAPTEPGQLQLRRHLQSLLELAESRLLPIAISLLVSVAPALFTPQLTTPFISQHHIQGDVAALAPSMFEFLSACLVACRQLDAK